MLRANQQNDDGPVTVERYGNKTWELCSFAMGRQVDRGHLIVDGGVAKLCICLTQSAFSARPSTCQLLRRTYLLTFTLEC